MHNGVKRSFVLISVMIGMFLSAIEATIVATAMPSIVADLQYFSLYSWVFSAYLLTSSVTMLLFGKLADLFGRKIIYIIGMCFFLLGSIMAGLSPSMVFLIVARFIQGIGAGAIIPLATTIVGDIYNKVERAKIQGYLSSVWGVSAVIGPLIGAYFVDYLHWRYVFWMNIPLGVISALGILVYLQEKSQIKTKKQMDIAGTMIIIAAISLLMYILVEGTTLLSGTTWQVYGLIGLFLLLAGLFIFQERRAKQPMMPGVIWSHRLIRYANIASLLSGMVMISVSSYLPTFVQGVMGKSAIIAGFALTSMSIGWPIASSIAGNLLLKIGSRKTALIGAFFLLVGAMMFMLLPTMRHPLWAGVASFMIGIGMGFMTTSFIVAIQTMVAWEIRGIATAVHTFMRSLGSAVGVAFLGGLLNRQIQNQIDQAHLKETVTVDMVDRLLDRDKMQALSDEVLHVLQNGLVHGLQHVYNGIGIIVVLTLICIWLIPKHNEEKTGDEYEA